MKVDPAQAPVSGENGVSTQHLSVAGGLTQFGAYIETLAPGAWSSHRHWHDSEDEFLYVLEGVATLRDGNGMTDLHPGDAVCWPHGNPNAHHITNRSDAPACYLIQGSRVANDICRYPDSGRVLINSETRWKLVEADGTVIREGDLPAELLNLPPVWGTPFDPATPHPQVFRAAEADWQDDPDTAHPILGTGPGPYRYRLISDLGGISQFGAFVEELPPGSRSGRRHWHETEDEMILMLEGEAVLVEDGETVLRPGDMACWPAGVSVGHRLDNRSGRPVRYLVIGTRHERDRVHYTDHDLITEKDGTLRRYFRRDGSRYEQGPRP